MEAAIKKGGALQVSEVSYADVISHVLSQEGEAALVQVRQSLESLPLALVPSSRDIAEAAGHAMHSHALTAPAAFAWATAKAKKAELLSADPAHKRASKDVKVGFIG
jgi:hypothetical protein